MAGGGSMADLKNLKSCGVECSLSRIHEGLGHHLSSEGSPGLESSTQKDLVKGSKN